MLSTLSASSGNGEHLKTWLNVLEPGCEFVLGFVNCGYCNLSFGPIPVNQMDLCTIHPRAIFISLPIHCYTIPQNTVVYRK
jgi:hypothetical protein